MEAVVMLAEEFADFYRGKVVLLTGHTGFKGAWMAAWLSSLGAKVIGYALAPPSKPSLFERLKLADHVANVEADVRDFDRLRSTMSMHKPDIVFHLAAQSLVRPSYKTPRETFDTNVMGTVNVLDAVRHTNSVRCCVVVTSDKCYENREWVYAYRENDPMGGFDPYSASKGAAELVVASYRNSFFNSSENCDGVAVASTRAGNVIGGGDWAEDRIIPDSVRALSKGESIQVRNPQAIRPWQHVLEPLSGYLLLAMRMWHDPAKFAQAWNFGPTAAGNVNVANIVTQVVRNWRSGQWNDLSQGQAHAPHEAKFLRLDCSKAASLLGWQPVYSVDESVRETVKWYFAHYNDRDLEPLTFSLRQIDDYMQRVRNASST